MMKNTRLVNTNREVTY